MLHCNKKCDANLMRLNNRIGCLQCCMAWPHACWCAPIAPLQKDIQSTQLQGRVPATSMLVRNYRSHRRLLDLPSKLFYQVRPYTNGSSA